MEKRKQFLNTSKNAVKLKIEGKCILEKIVSINELGTKAHEVNNVSITQGKKKGYADFEIYPDYHKVYRGKTEVILSKAEYDLFILLSERPGVIFTKEKIFEILYQDEAPENIDNMIYCLVSSVRKKIEPEYKRCRYIKTVRGVGYKFEGKKVDIYPI